MKLVRLNIQKDNNKFQPFETDENFAKRRHKIVPDDYNFNENGDEDVTDDPLVWRDHHKRLGINYMHAYKAIYSIIFIAANPNYPTIDWSGIDDLPDEWNELGVKLHVYPLKSQRVGLKAYQAITDEEDENNWELLTEDTEIARVDLYQQMRKKVSSHIPKGNITLNDSRQMFRDLFPAYLFYTETNDAQLKVWITSIDDSLNSGFDHSTDGFESKVYFHVDIQNDLIAILDGTHYA